MRVGLNRATRCGLPNQSGIFRQESVFFAARSHFFERQTSRPTPRFLPKSPELAEGSHQPSLSGPGGIVARVEVQPEGPGLEAIAEGFRHLGYKDDNAVNAVEWIVYDALYAYCQEMVRQGKSEGMFARR